MTDKTITESSKEVISELKKEHPEIKQLPPESQAIVSKIVAQVFSGPLPPPAVLDEYKKIDPSIPARLLQLVEKEQAARLEWNKNEAECKKKDLRNVHFGQIAGTLLVVFLAICGLVALYVGAYTVAGVIFGTTIFSLFSAKIFTNRKM